VKLGWTEPWSRERARRQMREAAKAMPSARKIAAWSGVLSFAAMVGVRHFFPGSEEVLTWGRMAFVALACSLYAWFSHFVALFPTTVHISEKGVFFQVGNGGGLVKRDSIRSISFEDREGLHLFVVRGKTTRGKDFERTAVASAKIPDTEVEKFLFDADLAHLYRKGGTV